MRLSDQINLKGGQDMHKLRNVILMALIFSLFAGQALAAVTVKRNGVHDGEAQTINLVNPSGSAYTYDGGEITIPVLSDTLFAIGMATGGATSMASTTTAIPTSYGFVRLALLMDPAFNAKTLAAGEPGQLITVQAAGVTGVGGASRIATITPVTSVGFSSVQLNNTGDQVTFLWLNDTDGWSVYDYAGSPTFTLKP